MAAPIGASTATRIDRLIPSFELSLAARNRSPRTIRSYGDTARLFAGFLAESGRPVLIGDIRREDVEAFIKDQLEQWRPATAAVRYRSLQQFFNWLVDEDEIAVSPMARMRPPTVPDVPVPVVSDDDLTKLLRACEGGDFEARRDTAILRVMIDTGIRLAETTGLQVDDVDWNLRVLIVTGKGRRPRSVPFGAKTAQALDRYRRIRDRHPLAGVPSFWLGSRGGLTDSGLSQMLRRRCHQAGIPAIHPHQLRHTAAHEWLSRGGNEGDAMQLFGWRSREMLSRYGRSAADQRARDAHRRLSPGDRV